MDKKIIVDRIEQLIIEKQITAYQLQNNADISSTYYQWKKNTKRDENRMPSLRSVEKICNFLDVTLAYFFTMDEDEQHLKRRQDLFDKICKLTDEQIRILEELVEQLSPQ